MILRNRISLILLTSSGLLFASSCSSSFSPWKSESSKGSPATLNSIRLYLPPAGGCGGLELEMIRTCEGIRLYLNVFGLEIPADNCNSDVTMVFVSFKERSYTFCADRMLGGQRLLIPMNVQEDIIDYLQRGQPVFIRVDRYQANICPAQFLLPFKQMISHPL